jgi:anti-sigma regulatory factor (Ser/Thr protein kinase)
VRRARHAVLAYAYDNGAADPKAIALAVSEVVSNAVLHAYVGVAGPGEIELTAQRFSGDGLEIVVTDDGRGMQPRPDSPGIGVGLPLVAAVTERFEVQARPGGGTRVCMTFTAAA